MPTISVFFGIVIRMYYDDHTPPHFHAYHGEHEAILSIDTLEVLQGKLPKKALAMILEWATEHRESLRTDWTLAEQHQPLRPIEPLK